MAHSTCATVDDDGKLAVFIGVFRRPADPEGLDPPRPPRTHTVSIQAHAVRAWAVAEIHRRALLDMAADLEGAGVQLLAVKGIYLVYELGLDAVRRPMQDADAIVVGGSYDRAVRTLARSGKWNPQSGWSSKTIVRAGPNGGSVDLHRMPLPLFFGAMSRADLRRRAHRSAAFEGRVLVPDVQDGGCLALAHFVKDALPVHRTDGLVRDLRHLEAHAGLEPRSLASRLREHRLRDIGVVAFTALALVDPAWESWLAALAPSRLERRCATALVRELRGLGAHPALAHVAVRSLSDGAMRRLAGFSAAGARLLRDAVRELSHGKRRH